MNTSIYPKMFSAILFAFCINIICVESRMLPASYITERKKEVDASPPDENITENFEIKVAKAAEPLTEEDIYNYGANFLLGPQEKCAVLVLSSQGQASMQQSLLRRYRYNELGDLIPNSVQYFIKFPQGGKSSTILIPLKYKALAPSGGFVRYYKETSRSPKSWDAREP